MGRKWWSGPSLLIAAMVLMPMVNGGVRQVMAQETAALIVNNDAAANPNLVQAAVGAAGDAQSPGSSLMVPEGFTVTVIASGLSAPRFMVFDRDGSLLVADQAAGAVYRYGPNAETVIEPSGETPEPLIADLDAPSSLAFFDVEGTTYLYVGEESQIT